MITLQPMIARAGSGEVHWDICALEAPGVVGTSVLIGGAVPPIADVVEKTNIIVTREKPYRMTFPTA